MQLYRTILRNEHVDALLRANASARHPGEPLLLGRDLDLLRASTPHGSHDGEVQTQRIASFFVSDAQTANMTARTTDDDGNEHSDDTMHTSTDRLAHNAALRAVDHARVHQAFADGFELVVHDMHLRSLAAFDVVDAIEAFWTVPASAALHFVPAQSPARASMRHAEDLILVQLDGELDVRVYDATDNAAMPEHANSATADARGASDLSTSTPHTFRLYEGDTLYVPRGCAMDTRTGRKISLHLAIAVSTHDCTVRDALLAVIDAVEALNHDTPNPLCDLLMPSVPGLSENKATYADLLRIAVHVAAEITPDLGNHFPVGITITDAIDDSDAISPKLRLAKHLDDFTIAAREALFEPMVDLLASEDNWTTTVVNDTTSDVIVAWAKEVGGARPTEIVQNRARRMFEHCIQYVRRHMTEALADAVARTTARQVARLLLARKPKLELVQISLARHGEPVTFSSHGTSSHTSNIEQHDGRTGAKPHLRTGANTLPSGLMKESQAQCPIQKSPPRHARITSILW
jgi:hypothetical protein